MRRTQTIADAKGLRISQREIMNNFTNSVEDGYVHPGSKKTSFMNLPKFNLGGPSNGSETQGLKVLPMGPDNEQNTIGRSRMGAGGS